MYDSQGWILIDIARGKGYQFGTLGLGFDFADHITPGAGKESCSLISVFERVL
jgi:hypothetical protein